MYINLITIDLCPGQNGGGVTPSGTLNISENGEYDVYSYASASVNVPSPQFVTESLSVSANGTYTPGEGVDGYSQVVVDVPQNVTGFTEKDLTEGAVKIINLNNSASFVASNAFNGNGNIQTVNLPYATFVGDNAFNVCNRLSQISLPVCSIVRGAAFYNCKSLSQISLPMCTKVMKDCFQGCTSLSQISLPVCNKIENAVFWGCTSLSQVSLPVCSYIDRYVFYNCKSLSQISFPVCNTIGANAFQGCSLLSIITIGYSSVCKLDGSGAFAATKITSSTGSIYVPASLVDAYKSANNWSYFSTQIFPISE